jgi:hypothetical protein
MATHDIGRRTVAFFVLKSAVNFVAVAVVGTVMWLGLGPDVSVAVTLPPAALAVAAMAAVAGSSMRETSSERRAVARPYALVYDRSADGEPSSRTGSAHRPARAGE